MDCMVSEWTEWSECNKSCGKGHTIRTRMVKLEPNFGGEPCPETVQRKKCNIRKCKRGSRASEEKKRRRGGEHCGGGIQERFMALKKRAKSAPTQITSCKDKKEIRACNGWGRKEMQTVSVDLAWVGSQCDGYSTCVLEGDERFSRDSITVDHWAEDET
ncbi:unnamed protein product, partial [Coregonus sp. 'balchen']